MLVLHDKLHPKIFHSFCEVYKPDSVKSCDNTKKDARNGVSFGLTIEKDYLAS